MLEEKYNFMNDFCKLMKNIDEEIFKTNSDVVFVPRDLNKSWQMPDGEKKLRQYLQNDKSIQYD